MATKAKSQKNSEVESVEIIETVQTTTEKIVTRKPKVDFVDLWLNATNKNFGIDKSKMAIFLIRKLAAKKSRTDLKTFLNNITFELSVSEDLKTKILS